MHHTRVSMSTVALNLAAFGLRTVTLGPCPRCEGSGEVVFRTGLDTEQVYACPRCGGTGSVEDDRMPALSTRTKAQIDAEFPPEEGLGF